MFQSTLSSDNNNNNNIIQTTDMKASEALAKYCILFAQLYQHTDGANRRGRMLMAQRASQKSNDEINNRNVQKVIWHPHQKQNDI